MCVVDIVQRIQTESILFGKEDSCYGSVSLSDYPNRTECCVIGTHQSVGDTFLEFAFQSEIVHLLIGFHHIAPVAMDVSVQAILDAISSFGSSKIDKIAYSHCDDDRSCLEYSEHLIL